MNNLCLVWDETAVYEMYEDITINILMKFSAFAGSILVTFTKTRHGFLGMSTLDFYVYCILALFVHLQKVSNDSASVQLQFLILL